MANNRPKTHCVWGHEFSPDNTVVTVKNGRRHRYCRECNRANSRDYYRRTRGLPTLEDLRPEIEVARVAFQDVG